MMISGGDQVNRCGWSFRSQAGVRKRPSAGIERALYLGAQDAAFCEALVKDRDEAAARRGIRLTASERAMLQNIPEAQLRRSITGMDLSEDNVRRRSFLRAVAVSAAALAAGQPMGK